MTTYTPTTQVLLHVNPNGGYAPDQITDTMTLGALLRAVQDAIAEYGEDVEIVTVDSGNYYGAQFGSISTWDDTFTPASKEREDD